VLINNDCLPLLLVTSVRMHFKRVGWRILLRTWKIS